jgi:hypothetical protein
MLDFSKTKTLTIPEGKVARIVKQDGSEVWSKPSSALHPNLKCYLSGSQNTRAGYVSNSNVWEDLSGNANDFNLTNVTFNGSDAIFNGTNSAGSSNFVLQAPYTVIVRLTRKGSWKSAVQIPIHNYETDTSKGGDGIILRSSSMEVSFRTADGNIQAVSTSLPGKGDCYVAYTRDAAGNAIAYFDGVNKGSKTGRTGTSNEPFYLGTSQTFPYCGGIEFVKIYDKVLTQAEIVAESQEMMRNKFRNGLIKTTTYISSLDNNGLRIKNNYSTTYCDLAQLNLKPNTTYYIHAEKEYSHTRANATGRIANANGLGTILEYNVDDGMFTTGSTIEGSLMFYGMSQSQAGDTTNDIIVDFKNIYIGTTPYQSGNNTNNINYINYIENTSNDNYIDTGIKPNQNTTLVVDVEALSVAQYCGIAGSRDTTESFCFFTDKTCWRADFYTKGSVTSYAVATNDRITLALEGNKFKINGTQYNDFSTGTFTVDQNIWLLGVNSRGAKMNAMSQKFYGAQIYDNGTLIRNFRPCKDENNVICCYESVEKKYYYLDGTNQAI